MSKIVKKTPQDHSGYDYYGTAIDRFNYKLIYYAKIIHTNYLRIEYFYPSGKKGIFLCAGFKDFMEQFSEIEISKYDPDKILNNDFVSIFNT